MGFTRLLKSFKTSRKPEPAQTAPAVAQGSQSQPPPPPEEEETARPAPALVSSTVVAQSAQDEVQEESKEGASGQDLAQTGIESASVADVNEPGSANKQLQQRLWNDAYEQLKADDAKLVESYELILSEHMLSPTGNEGAADEFARQNEISNDPEKRQQQMEMLKEAGLERTRKGASVKAKINSALQTVAPIRDILEKSLKASQEAAAVWSGVSLIFEVKSYLFKPD